MGQRLVVSIQKDERRLCNIYYHWSAYTVSALYETKRVIDCIYNHKDESERDMLLRLIHFCEDNGGGISNGYDSAEWKYIQNLYPNETFKADGISRSDGLISLSEKEMDESQSWSEGDVYIYLDSDSVNFGVYGGYDSLEEYIEERKEWDDEFDEADFKDIPEFDFDLGSFSVNDIDEILSAIDSVKNGIAICDGDVCEFIE